MNPEFHELDVQLLLKNTNPGNATGLDGLCLALPNKKRRARVGRVKS